MKRLLPVLAAALLLGGCATNRLSGAEQFALHQQYAGAPVDHFNFVGGTIHGWTPLGDRALTVWTRPGSAYLLELTGPCYDLTYAPAITLTNQFGRVSARFDSVIVRGGSAIGRVPCRIREIRPLDVKALRETQREMRQADVAERADAAL